MLFVRSSKGKAVQLGAETPYVEIRETQGKLAMLLVHDVARDSITILEPDDAEFQIYCKRFDVKPSKVIDLPTP